MRRFSISWQPTVLNALVFDPRPQDRHRHERGNFGFPIRFRTLRLVVRKSRGRNLVNLHSLARRRLRNPFVTRKENRRNEYGWTFPVSNPSAPPILRAIMTAKNDIGITFQRPLSRILLASSRDRFVCRRTRLRVGSRNDFRLSSDPTRRYSTN